MSASVLCHRRVYVTVSPADGKANAHLIVFPADTFSIPKNKQADSRPKARRETTDTGLVGWRGRVIELVFTGSE